MKKQKKKFLIEVDEDQMFDLEHACEFMARFICGQLDAMAQYQCEEAYDKRNNEGQGGSSIGTQEWWDMRKTVEECMDKLRKTCWGYKGNETMGIGYSDKSDRYWDMYQSLRKARYDMVFDDEEREEMKHTVMAYSPMRVSSKPLIQVTEKKQN
jgi:hypothetical protein